MKARRSDRQCRCAKDCPKKTIKKDECIRYKWVKPPSTKIELPEMHTIISNCSYREGWDILFKRDKGGRPYIQLKVSTPHSQHGGPVTWKSGKRYLSIYMCRQEIVSAVFSLITDAEEHERREFFRYKGAAIYNAHLDPDALAKLAKKNTSFNLRDKPMEMSEDGLP